MGLRDFDGGFEPDEDREQRIQELKDSLFEAIQSGESGDIPGLPDNMKEAIQKLMPLFHGALTSAVQELTVQARLALREEKQLGNTSGPEFAKLLDMAQNMMGIKVGESGKSFELLLAVRFIILFTALMEKVGRGTHVNPHDFDYDDPTYR